MVRSKMKAKDVQERGIKLPYMYRQEKYKFANQRSLGLVPTIATNIKNRKIIFFSEYNDK
jgi:hypothetical protein